MTDQPDVPRPPGVDDLLAAVAATLPPCCPADYAEDINEHDPDCDMWVIDRINKERDRKKAEGLK